MHSDHSQQLFQTVFTEAGIGIAILDTRGRSIKCNPQLQQILGYDDEELSTLTFSALTHPDDRERNDKLYVELIERQRDTYSIESRYYHKDGRLIWVHLDVAAISDYNAEPRSAISMFRDITERKNYEEKLQRSNKDLEQFAYIASHDLQEPLRTVSSFLQLLERRYGDQLDEKATHYICQAVKGAERMKDLIGDLLTFSRVNTQTRAFAPIPLALALSAAQANLETTIAESGAIVEAGPLPTLFIDQIQIVQLFQNLIGNAIKFCHADTPRVYIDAEDQGYKWCIRIRDNGIGIDSEYSERIFIAFQRLHTREEYPGNGIGLAVCKRIVERHGGTLWFESEPGAGTSFFFTVNKEKNRFDPSQAD